MTQELRRLAEDFLTATGMNERLQARFKFEDAANPAAILSLLDRLEKAEKDAERYRVLRDYLLSDDTSHDDAIVNATTAQQMNLVVDSISFDAAMEASK